jgi:hypothetical protein
MTIFFPTRAAATRLSVSERTLEKWRVTGGGPAYYKFGGKIFYTDESLDEWTASRRRRSTSDSGRVAE